jgi:nucleoside-diphosphate-sugar epimerase
MAKVLVTGANGFIGRNLVERLAGRGEEITCLVRKTSHCEALAPFDVRLVRGDVTVRESLPEVLQSVDVVYHVAGYVRARNPQDMYRVNGEGAANVADACAAQTSPPVLIYVSSLAAAGPSSFDRPHLETDPTLPVSHYGKSKLAGEKQLQQRAGRQPISIVRPPIVFGPGDHDLLPMFKSIRFGLHAVPGFTPQRFSLVAVGDLTEALVRTAERGKRLAGPGDASYEGLYYVTTPETPTYAELGRLIARALSRRRLLVLPTPHALGWLVAGVNVVRSSLIGRPLLLNADKMREATAGSWTCCGDRAAEQLDFRPAHALEHDLRETAEWYRRERLL